jgi:Glycosyl transferase family 2
VVAPRQQPGSLDRSPAAPLLPPAGGSIAAAGPSDTDSRPAAAAATACIVSASEQNVFFGELLDALAHALRDAGLNVERAVDHFPPIGDRAAYVFVPHEFLPLVETAAHPSAAQLRRTVGICTEQPGTPWFEIAAEACARCGAAVDINGLGRAELRRRGVDARHLQLGYTPIWDTWQGDRAQARPIDFVFMGGYTRRRADILARCGSLLSTRRARIQLTETVRPHLQGSPQFLAGERKWHALRDSRLLLNVHRGELGYLEWQRIVESMINGCVVLTEHSSDLGPLEPGRHLLSVSLDSVPMVAAALLDDEERLSAIRKEAYRLLHDELPLARTVEPLAEAVDALASKAHNATSPEADSGPRPLPPAAAPTPLELIRAAGTDDAARAAQTVLGRHGARRGEPDLVEVQRSRSQHGPREHAEPAVSVVFVAGRDPAAAAAAVESVACSDLDQLELIVVAGPGEGASASAIEEALSRCPWLTATVNRVQEPLGTAAARNLGVGEARSDLVFMLDADTLLYPHAVGRLLMALERDPDARFAYGIAEQLDRSGSHDLSSWIAWDPARLRYGDFIQASALIRRDAIQAVGGYPSEESLEGWEAFALWCAFADRGWSGVSVPEILTRRRAADTDGPTTPTDADQAWLALAGRSRLIAATQ